MANYNQFLYCEENNFEEYVFHKNFSTMLIILWIKLEASPKNGGKKGNLRSYVERPLESCELKFILGQK